MHLVLANRLGRLPRNSVFRLTDPLDMIIVVEWDVKPQIKQTNTCRIEYITGANISYADLISSMPQSKKIIPTCSISMIRPVK